MAAIPLGLSKTPLGLGIQDCALITNLYERGAHSTPTEAAVFATFNRSLENTKSISKAMVSTLGSYLKTPTTSSAAAETASAAGFSAGASGTQPVSDEFLQGFNLSEGDSPVIQGVDFGNVLLDKLKECIPCLDRLTAFLEIKPNINLLAALKIDVLLKLKFLTDLGDLLKDINKYADFCDLLGLLSFMCIPDLQRLIALLMALLMLDIPKFDGIIGLLQGLILPIFAPILTAITSLLDQFSLTVMSPIDCILDAINQQLRKLGYELNPENPLKDIESGISDLNNMVTEAKQTIQEKLDYYIENVKALLGELGTGDASYLLLSIKKLKIIRMVAFLVSIIKALTKGALGCSEKGQRPEDSELDHFFNNYLNPNSSFEFWLDNDGQIHVDEKIPNRAEALSVFNTVVAFEGEDAVVDTAVKEANKSLTQPASVIIPCRLKQTTEEDATKINQWISELNKV